ncbi:MAG: hypothetical protein LQ348_006804 [Seirophora lacunosa]|nr:MAG: hypothetical protein LQ348_006804 [Seirophora lacunosa]
MAASFDALLQADRKKRNEELAQKLLGGGRRSITPSNGVRKHGPGASLASRIAAPNVPFPSILPSHTTGQTAALADPFLEHSALSPPHRASKPTIEAQQRPICNVPTQAYSLAMLVQIEKTQWRVSRKEKEYRKT